MLDRILEMSSEEGDIILDPFCGCGTTIASAKKLNRKFIGVDISKNACELVSHRVGGRLGIINRDNIFAQKIKSVVLTC